MSGWDDHRVFQSQVIRKTLQKVIEFNANVNVNAKNSVEKCKKAISTISF